MVYNGKPDFFFTDDLGGKPTIFGNIHMLHDVFLQDLLSGSFFISKVSKMTFCSCFEPHRGRRLPSTRGLRHPPQLVLTEKSKHKRSTNTLFNTTSPLVPSFPPVHFSVINQHVDCATKNDIMGDQLTSHTLKILIKVQLILGSSGGVIHLIVKLICKRPPISRRGGMGMLLSSLVLWVHHPPFSAWETFRFRKCHGRHWAFSIQKRPTNHQAANVISGTLVNSQKILSNLIPASWKSYVTHWTLDMILDQRVHWSVAQFLTHYVVLLLESLFYSTFLGILCLKYQNSSGHQTLKAW